jgi:hypothetical protein
MRLWQAGKEERFFGKIFKKSKIFACLLISSALDSFDV